MGNGRKIFLSLGLLVFFFSAATSYLILQIDELAKSEEEGLALASSEVAVPTTFLWQEAYEVCSLYELDCTARQFEAEKEVEERLAKLDLQEIAKIYPLPEWSVVEHNKDIIMTRNLPGLCPEHKKIYHFGVNAGGNYLAVLYGPHQVGTDGGVYLLTDIAWRDITPEEQKKILQGEYEFYFKEDMIVALDSFSELAKKDE